MACSCNSGEHLMNDCGCCAGLSAATPVLLHNRPGLSAVSYRVGTHSLFKSTLLARLSGSGQPGLRQLNTRDDDDFSIALLDAWATVADVLTFYQERIANEAFLRTSTERLSIRELARLIGYELRPGVAASVELAFTIEDTPGAFGQAVTLAASAQRTPEIPPPITIEAGAKVQSIPGPGEQAQTFETIEAIEARAEFNVIRPRMNQPQSLNSSMGSVFLSGTATNLKAGDALLLNISWTDRALRTVVSVKPDEETKTTRVDFQTPGLSPPAYSRLSLLTGTPDNFPAKVDLSQTIIEQIIGKQWSEANLAALAEMQGWNPDLLAAAINQRMAQAPAAWPGTVHAMRQRAAVFGYNAPKEPLYTTAGIPEPMSKWGDPSPNNEEAGNKLFLDNAYDGVLPLTYVAVLTPTSTKIFRISAVVTKPRTAYAISGKTTALTLADGNWWDPATDGFPGIRNTGVLVQSEALPAAQVPIEDLVAGDTLTLDRAYVGLKIGRRAILTGERSDLPGSVVNEVRTLKEVLFEAGFTVVTFDKPLQYSYVRKSVLVNANVALATHGETVAEVLGGGNASESFQKFTLQQPPLTHTSAGTPSGTQSTLEVRINDILWEEVPFLYGHEGDERIYQTQMNEDGKTDVMFGDGASGRRLTTGQANVTAKYRKGIGLAGLVQENRLTQMITRPLGVKAVTNPLAAAGAADPESLDEARENAPLTILTLDRIVSLQDYEDFARAFAGIGKALATWVWSGQKRGVFVTIAGSDGADVAEDGKLFTDLLNAMRDFGDPNVPLWVKSFEPRLFRTSAEVHLNPDYLESTVVPAIEEKLRQSFSFKERSFGQPVHLSEVIALIQNIEGVVAVDVNELYRTDQPSGSPLLNPRLTAFSARIDGGSILAAELLTLDPGPIGLG